MEEHKQYKPIYFGIFRTQFSYHSKLQYNTLENKEADLKYYVMKLIESFKEAITNWKIQENVGK